MRKANGRQNIGTGQLKWLSLYYMSSFGILWVERSLVSSIVSRRCRWCAYHSESKYPV